MGNCRKITPLNHASVEELLRARGCTAQAVIGAQICRETCYTDEMLQRKALLIEASSHIGKPVARDTGSRIELGDVRSIHQHPKRGVVATFIVEWRPTDRSDAFTEQMSIDDLVAPERLGAVFEQQRLGAVAAAARRTSKTAWMSKSRLERQIGEDAGAEAEADGSGVGDFDTDGFLDDDPLRGESLGELNKSQRQTLRRALSRRTIFSQRWWESRVTRDGKPTYRPLHSMCFGFEEPHDLRAFYHHTFAAYHAKRSSRNGLGPFEYYCLALLHARLGLPMELLGGLMGTDRSHLGRHIGIWIHRLGEVGKRALVGLPDCMCIDAMRPQDCKDCGMGDLGLIGDGCSLMTEAVRKAWLAHVGDQMMDSKTDHAGGKGMLFTDGCGGACIASDLALGRASEGNLVRALRDKLDGLPSHLSVCYDKGIRGLNMLLPRYNHVYMPNFLAPSEGKTQFSLEEAFENKGIATNRYVVEIAFQRVKMWRLLTGEIRRESFHLINSVWWWVLGFSNMYMRMLKEPAVP